MYAALTGWVPPNTISAEELFSTNVNLTVLSSTISTPDTESAFPSKYSWAPLTFTLPVL